jgi:hypothetical protein
MIPPDKRVFRGKSQLDKRDIQEATASSNCFTSTRIALASATGGRSNNPMFRQTGFPGNSAV